jgi:hypothetical protein
MCVRERCVSKINGCVRRLSLVETTYRGPGLPRRCPGARGRYDVGSSMMVLSRGPRWVAYVAWPFSMSVAVVWFGGRAIGISQEVVVDDGERASEMKGEGGESVGFSKGTFGYAKSIYECWGQKEPENLYSGFGQLPQH